MLTPKQNIDLLERTQRTFNLKRLIEQQVNEGDVVLDAGCGSGILSIWAAQAGASRVLAVDNGDMALPKQLAEVNGCLDRIEFVTGDLEHLEMPEDDAGRFDVVMALVYLNDPRRDVGQVALAHRLAQQFVREGGAIIPDRIAYDMTLASWPAENAPSKRGRIERRVRTLEQLYGLNMGPLLAARFACPDKADFPLRGQDGYLVEASMRLLSDEVTILDTSYRQPDPPVMPATIQIPVTQDGVADVVIWRQRLLYGDTLVFQNESVSWIEQPESLSRGDAVTIELGERWMDANEVRLALG